MKSLSREGDKGELIRRLQALRPDSPPRWGRMSAPQMVCHLGDAFLMALGQQPVSDCSGLLPRTLVKWLALYVPLPWPGGRIATRPEIDQVLGGGTKPAVFADDVERLRMLLDRVGALPGDFDWPPHPVFGRMSRAAWFRWSYLHVDHHLRQFGA